MLLGETSELSLELAIEGRFDRSKYVVPSGVAKKYLTLFWSAKHSTRTVAVPSAQGRTVRAQGPDGPRSGARLGLLPEGRTVRALGRTVRAYAGAAEDRRRRLDLAPGRDPVGEERS
jgi:hypothetical protein